MSKGVYSLFIELGKDQEIKIGKLGKFKFPKGFYIYTGSALNNLEARLERHVKKQKKKFWHIDYLLANKNAKIISVLKIDTSSKLECKLNQTILKNLKASFLVKKFGSSDCNCESHLIYLKTNPLKNKSLLWNSSKIF
ncbi:MAG: GIY-YIG nuclease family protein [Candidatus Aenigmatarchaeota archaeon]